MYTILVIDDDPDIRNALRIYLSAEGYRTLEAANGLEALSLIKTETIHLALLDIMMPGLDGIAATVKIRESSFSCRICRHSCQKSFSKSRVKK